jgi:hypothetical protein
VVKPEINSNSNFKPPLTGETPESACYQLSTCSKTVGSAIVQLLTATSDGNENYVSDAARQTANSLKGFTNAARGVAATSANPSLQNRIIDCTQVVLATASKLVIGVQKTIGNPANPSFRVI